MTSTTQATIQTSSGGKFVWIATNPFSNPFDRKIFKSFDYGSTFQDVTNLIPPTTLTFKTIQVGLSGDGRVVNIYERDNSLTPTSNIVYRSLDYGQTFTALTFPLPSFVATYASYGIDTSQDGSVTNTAGRNTNPSNFAYILSLIHI